MGEKYNINRIKNLGQWVLCPILAFSLAVKAIKAGGVSGYFGFLFGALIFLAMWAIFLFIYHKLFVERRIRHNEEVEAANKARIRSIMEEENDTDEYSDDDE